MKQEIKNEKTKEEQPVPVCKLTPREKIDIIVVLALLVLTLFVVVATIFGIFIPAKTNTKEKIVFVENTPRAWYIDLKNFSNTSADFTIKSDILGENFICDISGRDFHCEKCTPFMIVDQQTRQTAMLCQEWFNFSISKTNGGTPQISMNNGGVTIE